MYYRLIYAWKIQIYIRRLISLKAHEYLERNVKALTGQHFPANRAISFGQIQTAAIFLDINVKVAEFALRAHIMRRQWINLRYIRHSSGQRRTNWTAGTNQIAVRQGFGHNLMRNQIQYCKAMLYNGSQFLIQSFLDYFRQRVAVYFMRLFNNHLAYFFLRALHFRSIQPVSGEWFHLFAHVCNFSRICYNYLFSFILRQIIKFIQHFLSISVIHRSLVVRVRIALCILNYGSENCVSFTQKMHVSSSYDRLIQFFTQCYYPLIKRL